MKAISIRQPWAWLILHGGKDIENRSWATNFRGPVLIHASKGMTRDEYEDAEMCYDPGDIGPDLPAFEALERGGIVGQVEIVDCVTSSRSPWFFGKCGFVLANPKPLPFRPLRGQLGFFEVPPLPAPAKLEEGGKCGISGCNGEYGYRPVENCACHLNPPCSACVDNPLVCFECGDEPSTDCSGKDSK